MKSRQISLNGSMIAANLMLSAAALAAPLTVGNPSFEQPTNTADGATTTLVGWQVSSTINAGTAATFNPNNSSYAGSTDPGSIKGPLPGTADGGQVADLSRAHVRIYGFSTLTNTPFMLTPLSTRYTMTIAAAKTLSDSAMDLSFGFYDIDTATVLSTTTIPAATLTSTFADFSNSYVPPISVAGDNVALYIEAGAVTTGSTFHSDADNVRLDASVVPEPSSAAMVAVLATSALVLRRPARRG